MIILEKKTVKLEYNQAKKQLIQTWNGFSSSEVFREAIDETVKFVRTNKVDSIISDTLKQSVVGTEDTEYATKTMPALFQSGVKAMAFILPQNVLTKLALKGFDDSNKSFQMKFFASTFEAQHWIDQVSL